ncbi:MAG TPA: addiction module antidote protein [Luteibacter sp.]|nr:addiction module antidote protein [Luteibacter sp.]
MATTNFTPFDAAEFLDGEEAIAGYLTKIMAERDPDLFLSALGDVAKARGMKQVAEATGLSRESLYKSLRAGANPGYLTISKIMGAPGVDLVAAPCPHGQAESITNTQACL